MGNDSETGKRPRFKSISAPDLRKANLPKIKFLVDDILPEGTSLLSAVSKIGKSWMILDMGMRIAAGEPFLGHKTIKCGVLYLALEDSFTRLQDRMNKILGNKPTPELFDFAIEAPTLDRGLLDMIDTFANEHPETKLVIIDTLQKIRGQALSGEKSYAQDYREMGVIKSHMDKRHLSVIFLHHNRKMVDDDDPFNMISGTNGIMGAADTAWVLVKKKRMDENATMYITGRDAQASDTVIRFNKSTYTWDVIGGADWYAEQREREEYNESPIVKTIKKLLEQSPGKRWSGTAKDLLDAGKYIANTYLADNSTQLGHAIKRLDRPLFEYDRIMYHATGNGNAGKKHHFYYQTIGELPQTIDDLQQTIGEYGAKFQ